jgi:CO/xanthine dehydrogenase Mo-binding subunit
MLAGASGNLARRVSTVAGLKTIGTSVRRVDGVEKVTGSRRFSSDVLQPGTLWGKALRSQHPHARIVRIDTSAAQTVSGVYAVLTAADLPVPTMGRSLHDIPILARDRVRFIGERVAVVAAEDLDAAEEALSLIEVEYEPLPAVFDPLEAMTEAAPILHPDLASYRGFKEVPPIPNLHAYATMGRGNVEEGFAQAEIVFEDRFVLPMQHHAYLEPHACVVDVNSVGQASVWTANKMPFGVKASLAEAVDADPEEITVRPVSIGGDFGGKGSLVDEPLAYLLSRATGRPVRMVLSYGEEMTAAAPRHAAIVTMKSGLTRDGRLIAQHARLTFNAGAYAGNRPNLNLTGAEAACGVYRTPHAQIECFYVYTNQIPCGHFRGPGWVQACFAIESHLDMIAARMGLDPLEIRRRNVLDPDEQPANGGHWRNVRTKDVMEQALAMAGEAPRAPNAGRGLALSYQHIGTGRSGALMSVDQSGQVKLVTAVPDVGTGAHTTLCQIAAEVLTIDPESITVEIGDTDNSPYDSGSGADRVTHVAGTAVLGTATKLKSELCDLAAELMGWPEGAVCLEAGQFRPDARPERVAFRELAARAARASGGQVQVRHDVVLEEHILERNVTAHVVDVQVDPESGQVRVERVVSVQDIGRVLNPRLAEGQVQGAAMIGFGYGVMEGLEVEEGQVTTSHLGEYKIPCMADVPVFEQTFLENNEGPSPFESKAVGEVNICGMAPAIANAVYQAVGVRITDLPITAEKVFDALKEGAQQ